MTLDIAPAPSRASTRAPYPAHLTEHAVLRDGSAITIRPIRADDLSLERDFVCGLSPQTRYRRLLSGRNLQPGELQRLTDIDYRREMALVALATFDGVERELGVARYVRDDVHEARSCDFAIVVADHWQGQGLGETLLRSLLRVARAEGIQVVGGITLSDNFAMIALARKLGFRATLDRTDPSVTELRREADFPLPDESLGAVAYADLWARVGY